jgi:hypothetical protein
MGDERLAVLPERNILNREPDAEFAFQAHASHDED